MPASQSNKQTYGIALGFVGGFVISFDIPVIRLADSDPWFTLFVRGACLALIFAVIWLLRRQGRSAGTRRIDRDHLVVGITYGIGNIFFTLSVYLTSTASLVFILAFNSMIAAVMSWLIIGERPAAATVAAIAATILGVVIIVAGGLGQGSGPGNITAVLCSTTLAYALVRSRQSGKDMSLAPGIGGVVAAAFALPFVLAYSRMPGAIEWLLVNGLIVTPVANFCLALAPRFIPAPQVAIFFLIETVLAPVWVWIVFAEEPSRQTLLGGSIVLSAILAHSLWGLSLYRRGRRAGTAAQG